MIRPCSRAFTLIELLVVIAIIALLAGVFLPIYQNMNLAGKRMQSLANMRQLGIAFISYCNDNSGKIPGQGDQAPTWGGAAQVTDLETSAWYNALPRNYGNSKGLGDYATSKADFYKKGSWFYVPAAKYPASKLNAPLFAVAMCSKLFDATYISDSGFVRLQNFQAPGETCIFQESGVPAEKQIYPSQSSYNGQSYTFASRSVARYNGQTIIVFADGHAEALKSAEVVNSTTGKAYYPQLGVSSTGAPNGKVCWTLNPAVDANQ